MDLRTPDLEHLQGTPIPVWLTLCLVYSPGCNGIEGSLKPGNEYGFGCGQMWAHAVLPGSSLWLPASLQGFWRPQSPSASCGNLLEAGIFVCGKDFSEKPCGTGCVMRGNFESKWGSLSREQSLAFFVWLKPLVEEGAGVGATSSTGGRNPKRKTIHQL